MFIATDKASQRTKNRLSEHCNLEVVKTSSSVQSLQGLAGKLFKCRNCSWLGWLPIIEFTEECD